LKFYLYWWDPSC